MTILRTCTDCRAVYALDPEEIADGTYSPICTECMRRRMEANERLPAEVPIPEIN